MGLNHCRRGLCASLDGVDAMRVLEGMAYFRKDGLLTARLTKTDFGPDCAFHDAEGDVYYNSEGKAYYRPCLYNLDRPAAVGISLEFHLEPDGVYVRRDGRVTGKLVGSIGPHKNLFWDPVHCEEYDHAGRCTRPAPFGNNIMFKYKSQCQLQNPGQCKRLTDNELLELLDAVRSEIILRRG